MRDWYSHYRFSEGETTELFNTNMVWYLMNYLIHNGKLPRDLIDHNVRMDYQKLRHLILVDQQITTSTQHRLNGNFSMLKEVLEEGVVESNVVSSFPLEELADENNFLSLLYYFGLLTFGETKEGVNHLKTPNQTVRVLMYEYLRNIS